MSFPLADEQSVRLAAEHLSSSDAVLAPVIERAGHATMRPRTDHYAALVSSILSQQLSVKAADTIERRFVDLFGGAMPEPGQILGTDVEQLRSCGISRPKARYILDLAQHLVDGRLDFERIPEMTNDEVIAMLTDVKGVGEWTAHMYLMFCIGRLDVLPVGDVGIQNGVQRLYGLEAKPDATALRAHAAERGWGPYESVASWYIWHSLDNKPAI